jgi:trehalose 6-phosphate synthase/phosphatase
VLSKTEGSKWQLYNSVNLAYTKLVVQHFNDGDSVFVFDLELVMAPTLIGSRARTANICFFFNTPFPSAEIFRTIPVRKQILMSLLNADFIQFHCFTYARHFLSCCSTLLGLEYRPTRGGVIHLVFNGHHCHVRASHVGIDAETLGRRLQEDIVAQEQAKWRAKFDELGKLEIMVGYDDIEPLAGLTLKLKAFRSLLQNFPEYRKSTCLVQVAIPLQDSGGRLMHSEYVDEVKKLGAEIEATFPGCIMMIYEKLPFGPRTALFSVSDVLVNCAVRHGLSLVPFEYVLSSESPNAKHGSLLLSEFTACSRVIPGCMRFSPWRDEDVAKAIVKCLRQPLHERRHWHEQQTAWCKHNTVLRWAENILDDMKRVRLTMLEMGEDVKRSASCRVGLVKSTYKEISSHLLKKEQVLKAYTETKTRLIFLDVDLLIRPKEEGVDHGEEAMAALDHLVEDPGNIVFLLSNESRDNLLKWVRQMQNVDKIGLAAEDGYYYKWPGSPIDRWDIRQEVSNEFKDISNGLMQLYAVRTTGTFVEDDKVASITWHFGSTNPEFGAMQVRKP